jgi:hypothetical protein
LPAIVEPGDTVWVTDIAGKTVKGTIQEISTSSLVLGQRRSFGRQNVASVQLKGGVGKGVWIGLGVGIGVALAIGAANPGYGEGLPPGAFAFLIMAPAGAAIGATAAALSCRGRIVYQKIG